MAANDNQGLQIAVIFFVMLTIVFSVTTFIFFRQADEANKQREAAVAAQNTATTKEAATSGENKEKALWMAGNQDADHAAVKAIFDADIAKMAVANLPADKHSYHAALEFLMGAFTERSAALADALDQIETLKQEKVALETEKNNRIAAAEAAQKAAEADYTAEKAKFAADRAAYTSATDDLRKQLDELTKAKDAIAQEKAKNEETLLQKLNVTQQLATSYKGQLDNATTVNLTTPDGEVREVNQATQTVYLNIGSADGLTRQVTFSVYGTDRNSVARKEFKKGSIEVTQIMGPHLSQARVTDDNPRDPIVAGDKVENPAWHAGRTERFAIVGNIDLDGDSTPDNEVIRKLIQLNGGIVDAEMDAAGKQTGKVSASTRYLIRGEQMDVEAEGADVATDLLGKFQKEAADQGVEIISVNEFLDKIGYVNSQQVLRFGLNGNASEMPVDLHGGGVRKSSGNVSEVFKRRLPPKPRNSSAFDNN